MKNSIKELNFITLTITSLLYSLMGSRESFFEPGYSCLIVISLFLVMCCLNK